MSYNINYENAKFSFSNNVTIDGVDYKKDIWYTETISGTVDYTTSNAYPRIALDADSSKPVYTPVSSLSELSAGQYCVIQSSGATTSGSAVSTSINGVKCLMLTGGYTNGNILFIGTSQVATKYITTIDMKYMYLDGDDMTADNTDIYYGSLSQKATMSGTQGRFETPDGGGDCKIWFCKKGTTTPWTFSYIETEDGENLPVADDGSITLTLNSDSDSEYNLMASASTPKSSYKVELDFTELTIDDISVSSYSDLVIGYHFDTTTEVKVKYDGADISVTVEDGKYSTIYVAFYKEDGTAYDLSSVSVNGYYGTAWQIADNVAIGTLNTGSNSGGYFEGNLKEPSGTSSTMTIGRMYDVNDDNFLTTYSGAVLTYSPATGYSYETGEDFELTCVLSGGWKFDTTQASKFGIRGSGNPSYSAVTFVDAHTVKGTVDGSIVNPIVWFQSMGALKDEEPEPDYATFITPYLVSKADVNAIANTIWVSSDGSTITAASNILSYKEIYDTLSSDKEQDMKLGNYSLGRNAKYLVDYTYTRNLGSVDIEEYWHNADDYENTTIRVYVPLVGLVDIDTGLVMGHKLFLEYRYEIIDGKALAILYTDSYSPESIIYQGSANFAVDEPITSGNSDTYANSYWTILTNQLGDLKPYVLIDRKQPASGVIEQVGNKVQITKKVGDCSGYVEFEQIFVQDIKATSDEYSEIVSLLQSGVIV